MCKKKERIKMALAFGLLLAMSGTVQALPELPKGVGPITELKLDPIDVTMATKGKDVFQSKCSACHKMEERYVGPGLKGITSRRSPEWVMNMILNPQEMTQKDPEAQKLLEEYLMQMTFQNVTTEETRSILEYFRHYDEKGEIKVAEKVGGDKKGVPAKTKK
jgi:hypothetical protein